ncbi:MAG: hypothetical protein JWM41_2254 [Gemmatimonadetes bacterium]|nr:hypothetical protein [Gemmatimonadota bacterium]
MPRVLIVSPHFPPVNAADMHRVRQSLPYLAEMGWEATVLAVDPRYVEMARDDALLRTIPPATNVQHVAALDPRWTRKLGLGSVALRSLWQYCHAGNRLLARGDMDLVYFSTTMFPVTILGAYWKRRFGVPFVIDLQDPWHTDYYERLPKEQRPRKYWFSHRLDKYLEPIAMRSVDAVISVSDDYCATLRERYPRMRETPCSVIPFGGATRDFELLDELKPENCVFRREDGIVNVVYVGRGGHDMAVAAHAIFGALADGLVSQPALFSQVRLHFVGTSYGRADDAAKTIEPLAAQYGVENCVREYPARVPYFTALELLREADMLVIPGSTSPGYTASKLYPYILARRPILAIFAEGSSVVSALRETAAGDVVTFGGATAPGDQTLRAGVLETWSRILGALPFTPATQWSAFERYTARTMTRRQVEVFDRVVAKTSVVRASPLQPTIT